MRSSEIGNTNNQQEEKLARPEYFDNFLEEGYEKYAGYLKGYVDRIGERELEDINYSLGNTGYERGLEVAAIYIADALQIDKPRIKFQIIEEDKNGIRYGCDRRDNSIVIRRTPKEKYEDVLAISDAVEMLAHEFWHVHQNNEINNNSKRAQLYEQKHIKAEDDLEGYFRQPYELEAYVFGEMVRNKFNKTRKRVLKKELDRTIGAIAGCMADGNEQLVSMYIEDKDRIIKELRDFSEEEGDRIRDDNRRQFSYIHE
ncbi:hypothetical protein IJH24_01425 [Candidatus Saccharibacteria bacterium]|nr:hypothetical protein [Candidatus Saccharibacteria bacterium]